MTGARIFLLITWKEEGRWYFLRRLREAGLDVSVLSPWFCRAPRRLARLSVWASRFTLPLRAFFLAGPGDVVVSWSTPHATVAGLLKRLLSRVRPVPAHLVRDFHIDLSRAGEPLYAAKLAVLAWAMPGIDLILTTSRAEETLYAARYGRPRGDFVFLPDVPPSELFDLPPEPLAGHVFACGNSDRDFDTLVVAAASLDVPVVILSQNYVPAVPVPANLTILDQYVSRGEFLRLMGSARCCVVPLRDQGVAAGQNSMFEAMALGRPLVVSRNIAVDEYVEPGRNAVQYVPGDAAGLAREISRLLDDPEAAEAMGRRAREEARAWLSRQVDIFLEALRTLPR